MKDVREYVDFGAYVKARRKELGLTQEDVARLVGKSRSHIAQIETGTHPTDDVITKLILALKMPIHEFIEVGLEESVVSEAEGQLALMFTPLYKLLNDYLEPHEYMEVMTLFSDTNSMIQKFLELNNQAPAYDIAPEGWAHLSASDKNIIKKLVKSLAEKNKRGDE